ncbi:glycosyltransferase family 4 protein [Nocardioides sp. MH1]|uniref:glycosyltransferase family 4 protein n=1 Tax=Nocardioides sp. MH1 TaxID=3242490 RepID=UPI003520CB8D
MRVLQLVTQTRGGPVDHAVDVAVELVRLGHESHLVGPAGSHLALAAERGVVVHVADVRSKADVTGAHAVADVIDRVWPDVVHLQDRRAGLVGRVLAARSSRPSVYTLHGVPDELAGLVPGNLPVAPRRARDRWTYLGLERLLAATPRSVVVTPCRALAAYAREQVGIRSGRVRTVPNGVGPGWLAPPAARTQRTNVTATWLGLMEPVKRVPDLVRAAARVPGLALELVGDGSERGRIEAVVDEEGSIRDVHLAGYQSDPSPYLRHADVFVLPSAAEACPMALLQAMACGVPVVASRVGGVPEIVRNGVDGVLVDAGAVDQLTAALRLLAGDAGLRARLGAAGRERVAAHFGIEHTVRALLDVYEEVSA